MFGRIYSLNSSHELSPLDETPYDSEKLLQEILAKHPDLLAGEQMDCEEPRRWLLVSREMPIQQGDEGNGRWSLDHLFLDQDGIPTLVEVKRGSNTDVRRKVVGQMLDYAANAVVYWPVEDIQARFAARCEKNNESASEVLSSFLLDDGKVEDFWKQVKTNLQAGRIRMVFVADSIPTELRRVVEFLNEQMDPAEVLAVEVKKFVGKDSTTLVPQVFGQTESARIKKAPGSGIAKAWDRTQFMDAVEAQVGIEARKAAEDLLDWITPKATKVWWGSGSKDGGIVPYIVRDGKNIHLGRFASQGWFAFRFDWLYKKPPFDDVAVRRKLLAKINEIPGVHFTDEVLTKRARITFKSLASAEASAKFRDALSWLIEQVKP